MILYLDTSSLLKLFLEEEGSEPIKRIASEAQGITTSIIAYAESRAALARARRTGRLTDDSYRASVELFEEGWSSYIPIGVSDPIVRLAGDLAEKHLLKGFDAIHLASAVTLQQESGEPISFSAWDQLLMRTAAAEGLAVAA